MEILIAVGHFVGVVIVWMLVGTCITFIGAKQLQNAIEAQESEFALRLGIPIDEIRDDKWAPKLMKALDERFTDELLTNRISDLCGTIVSISGGLVSLIMVLTFLGVGALTIMEDLSSAVFVWAVIGIQIIWLLAYIVFSYLCKILTGRYPGQAKNARKQMLKFAEDHPGIFSSSEQ